MKNKRKLLTITAGVAIIIIAGYGYFMHTSGGRIAGLYLAGGWSAPGEVRKACKTESGARVDELFTKPLDMNDEAKAGLREYWHYSYYRECLYHAGYTFMGKPLVESTLATASNDLLRYTNPLAGASMSMSTDTKLVMSNELDVTFDYRLLRSKLVFGTTTLFFDTYTDHQFIHTFADLPMYLDHFPASQSPFISSESRITKTGIPFLYVEDQDGMCGAILVTPEVRILHLYATCANRDAVLAITDTLTFETNVASVH
ncbi:MAG: hypothetical protein KBD24_03020 [Candidatus Pacebacteria bacterium]|nr:hypothetical protein [Candidatus Paceibacterota bacterium]